MEPWQAGDIVPDEDGAKGGIVFWVDPADGTKAKIVSLTRTSLVWTTAAPAPVYGLTDPDGAVNMQKIIDHGTADDVPAVGWCQTFGKGWYWPSRQEIIQLYDFYNGGHGGDFIANEPANLSAAEKEQRDKIEKLFIDAGGDPLNGTPEACGSQAAGNGDSYWASTETSAGDKAFYIRFGKYGDLNLSKTSPTPRYIRAIRVVEKTN